jgi:hypothetical protein
VPPQRDVIRVPALRRTAVVSLVKETHAQSSGQAPSTEPVVIDHGVGTRGEPHLPVPRCRTGPAVVALYLLAALIPESIATGNTPVLSHLTAPATLPFLAVFYGGAAVAIRELWLRRQLGWRGLIMLGAAFGLANEGVIAETWYRVAPTGYTFTPGHPGVDVAWAVFLTVFHTVFSVVIPIMLVHMTVAYIAAGFLVPGIVAHLAPGRLPGFQALFVMLILAVAAVGVVVVWRWSRHPGWGQRQTLAIITGLLTPAMVLTTANPAALLGGAIVLSAPFTVLLIWLAQRHRIRSW